MKTYRPRASFRRAEPTAEGRRRRFFEVDPLLCPSCLAPKYFLMAHGTSAWGRHGHKDVSTTMVYTHALNRGGRGVMSPADRSGGLFRDRDSQAVAKTLIFPIISMLSLISSAELGRSAETIS